MMLNQFSRTALLIGPEAIAKLQCSRVAIFGIGGVGGYVAEALARSGVGSFEDKLMQLMEECSQQLMPPQSDADRFSIWFVAAGCIGLLKKWMIQPVPAARDAVLDRLDELLCRILQPA